MFDGLEYKKIHVCPNKYVLYKDDEDLDVAARVLLPSTEVQLVGEAIGTLLTSPTLI